jgi:hypothetical protein
MLKVTLKFSFYCVIFLFTQCAETEKEPGELEIQRYQDSLSELRIDSAYLAIKSNCDTLMLKHVPQMVDSFLKDSALLQEFFLPVKSYTDVDKKLERVVRQLQAECDSNLQKETYRRARLQQKSKPVRRKK